MQHLLQYHTCVAFRISKPMTVNCYYCLTSCFMKASSYIRRKYELFFPALFSHTLHPGSVAFRIHLELKHIVFITSVVSVHSTHFSVWITASHPLFSSSSSHSCFYSLYQNNCSSDCFNTEINLFWFIYY